ncbi:hypothetical protein U1Q18_021059, partial [Sarracenia purpurea var. burkii]
AEMSSAGRTLRWGVDLRSRGAVIGGISGEATFGGLPPLAVAAVQGALPAREALARLNLIDEAKLGVKLIGR